MIFVTGGAGFIGSNFILDWFCHSEEALINFDKLTYAGHLDTLQGLDKRVAYTFAKGDINNRELVGRLLRQYQPRAIVHFAAESHVDRSIHQPDDFIQANIGGTFHLLESVRHYWQVLPQSQKENFRFIHVSTDEVYGELSPTADPWLETPLYAPNNPYAASKAASDHLVRAWFKTYGMPFIITRSCNNYGPYQWPEKLIPLTITNRLAGRPMTVYGDGQQSRDWLYVKDHVRAIFDILKSGISGETYHISSGNEKTNLAVVEAIHHILATLRIAIPPIKGEPIIFSQDRLGHDKRYALDATKLRHEMGWQPQDDFETGIVKTVQWYVDHLSWLKQVMPCVQQAALKKTMNKRHLLT